MHIREVRRMVLSLEALALVGSCDKDGERWGHVRENEMLWCEIG